MTERYVILRRPEVDVSDPFAGTLSAGGPLPAQVGFKVEVADLSHRELPDLRRDPTIHASAPVMLVRLVAPMATDQPDAAVADRKVTWGVEAVGANRSRFSGQGITVAVLDTGIDSTHPAFKGAGLELIEKDFTEEGNGDANGHGTHCAGTVFGRDVDGVRIGVARGVKRALIGKVLGKSGGGSTDQIFQAINWAVDAGANVISMSLSIDFPGFVERLVGAGMPVALSTSKALAAYRANVRLFDRLAALIQARSTLRAAVLIAASGNESRRDEREDFVINAGPPAASDGIIAVGALGQSENHLKVAGFSNSGVSVAGPGVGVVSAKAGAGLTTLSGTSMATPHVAGVSALWAEKLLVETGQIDPTQLTAFVVGRADRRKIDGQPSSLDVGSGLVQAPAE